MLGRRCDTSTHRFVDSTEGLSQGGRGQNRHFAQLEDSGLDGASGGKERGREGGRDRGEIVS
jgi:hypothetical protein